jgi:hypothetical protein
VWQLQQQYMMVARDIQQGLLFGCQIGHRGADDETQTWDSRNCYIIKVMKALMTASQTKKNLGYEGIDDCVPNEKEFGVEGAEVDAIAAVLAVVDDDPNRETTQNLCLM